MNDDPVRPKSPGLTLTGTWRDCPALQDAYDRGSIVLDESDLCEMVGCRPEQLEAYLRENWREHDFNAVALGMDEVDQNNISLLQQHGGYFTLRLFSAVEPDSAIVRRLRKESVRPQVM